MSKYALTEREIEWLSNREAIQFSTNWYFYGFHPAALDDDYRDSAEFEARVATKLAEHAGSCSSRGGIGTLLRPHGCSWYNADGYRETVCPSRYDIDKCTGIPFCNLYLARITVEQEMDDELE